MTMKKLKDIITGGDDQEYEGIDENEELTDEVSKHYTHYEKPSDNKASKVSSQTVLVLFEPRSLNDTDDIASHLIQRKAAVVNMHRLDKATATRVCDFLAGVVYALDGKVKLVGDNVYLFTPKSIGVDGDIALRSDD